MANARAAHEADVEIETDVEIDRLRLQHGQLEKRLAELERHLSLTPGEQVERARLKKEKLRIKDRISELDGGR